jgi:hypothetical protein
MKNEEQILQIKKLNENEIEKKYNFINYLKKINNNQNN